MKIIIEKIANGYLVTCDKGPSEVDPLGHEGHKRIFCDTPEAICGVTSEWVLKECHRLETMKPIDVNEALRQAMKQPGAANPIPPWVVTTVSSNT
jgi:hypothetical protein